MGSTHPRSFCTIFRAVFDPPTLGVNITIFAIARDCDA